MAEYIERETLIKRLEVTPILKYGIPTQTRDGIIDLVKKQTAADVVERKQGHWWWVTEDIYKCDNCGEKAHVKEVMGKPDWEFCPNCGAIMKG